jgi:hypothetical protein
MFTGMHRLIRVIRHLADMGEYKLAKKIVTAHRGKPMNLSARERNVFQVVRKDVEAVQESIKIPHGAVLRKELYYNPTGGMGIPKHQRQLTEADWAKGGGSLSRGYFTETKKTPIVDIDFKGRDHGAHNTMFDTPREAIDNFNEFMKTKHGRKHAFKAYDTPGGIRLYDVSRRSRGTRPSEYEDVSKALGDDPYFLGKNIERDSYAARIMPKPGRPGDFVAKPKKLRHKKKKKISTSNLIIGKDATVSRKSLKEIEDIHDTYIRYLLLNLAREGKYPQKGLFALTDLKKHNQNLLRVENLFK